MSAGPRSKYRLRCKIWRLFLVVARVREDSATRSLYLEYTMQCSRVQIHRERYNSSKLSSYIYRKELSRQQTLTLLSVFSDDVPVTEQQCELGAERAVFGCAWKKETE